jgi:hypothetical protein
MSATTYPVETIAKLLGLTPRRVQQLSGEGVIPKAERGRYELVPAVQGYIKYLKDRAIGGDLPNDEGVNKGRLLKARADIAEMEAERLAGDLAPVDQIEKAWTEIVARFRQRSLSVAPKAAPLVAVETTTEACHEIIETYIHEALAELAATPVVGLAEPDKGGDGDDEDGGTSPEIDDL